MTPFVERLTARVFGHGAGGGNPVTIFRTASDQLSFLQRQRLARTCVWESVFVSKTNAHPTMAFHVPTGESVSFCVHAAMGGAWAASFDQGVRTKNEDNGSFAQLASLTFTTTDETNGDKDSTLYTACFPGDSSVKLHLEGIPWTEQRISHVPVLRRLLRDAHGITQLHASSRRLPIPHLVNSTMLGGRTKTIVYCDDVDMARAPRDAVAYTRLCDSLATSGLYLYTRHPTEDAWECVSASKTLVMG